jgi:hypothetical protein
MTETEVYVYNRAHRHSKNCHHDLCQMRHMVISQSLNLGAYSSHLESLNGRSAEDYAVIGLVKQLYARLQVEQRRLSPRAVPAQSLHFRTSPTIFDTALSLSYIVRKRNISELNNSLGQRSGKGVSWP